MLNIIEMHHQSIDVVLAPSKDKDQCGYLPSLIRVYAVWMKKVCPGRPRECTTKTDQTRQISKLILVFAGGKYHIVGFVSVQLNYYEQDR